MEKEQWQKKGVGHRQRLREKFLEKGIDSLTDQEIIELLLTFGTPRSDCKEAARNALKKMGSLPAVLDASSEELQAIKGIGPNNTMALHFIHGVGRRYLKNKLVGKKYIRSSKEVADYLIHSMRNLEREVFTVLYLDASHSILGSEVLAEGTVAVNTIYPREVIKAVLHHNASSLVISHNHPSGTMTPSAQDRKLTKTLYLACSLMHINLLDHLIIGNSKTAYSFADNGIMAAIRDECQQILR